jgi:hypothetical protein
VLCRAKSTFSSRGAVKTSRHYCTLLILRLQVSFAAAPSMIIGSPHTTQSHRTAIIASRQKICYVETVIYRNGHFDPCFLPKWPFHSRFF